MSMSDPIANMLTCVRNANIVYKKEVKIPSSNLKLQIARVMQEEGYIKSYKKQAKGINNTLIIELKYYANKAVIESIKRISKPSLRVYANKNNMPMIKNGLGVVVMSTSKGVMSGQSAVANSVGGEVLCSIF